MKTYKQIAEDDFRSAKVLFEAEMWNFAGQHLQQACEKQLKHYLDEQDRLDIGLARTHNLRKLLREIDGYDEDFYRTAVIVENYYFDTKYPGEEYSDLTKKDVETAIDFYNQLIKLLES